MYGNTIQLLGRLIGLEKNEIQGLTNGKKHCAESAIFEQHNI